MFTTYEDEQTAKILLMLLIPLLFYVLAKCSFGTPIRN